ncbi:pseudouridine-5'-phosphate glycosidase [Diaminobutyricibacter sp. McL0608]|uniref:pseudouridine-5'-phosphate glycosidase n=1 Tax=Leifsonia sp. McL0608 TaxID=3143537 RepID=UPI0031F313B3
MDILNVSEEVATAAAEGRPVVALESTIFTHGLVRPRNLEVALEAEKLLRSQGVTPATIGLVKGVPTVGLSTAEIEALSLADDAVKVSVRDIPTAVAKKLNAGTTVAGTAHLARLAGVEVFSTGGLGGVHQGAQHSFDESADPTTLAGLDMVVVSAGVKSILDIPLTLERFETLNLAIVGYRTTDYPGFYLSDSGYDIDYSVESPEEIAAIVRARNALDIKSTLLVANPVSEEQQLDPVVAERVIADAWKAAGERGTLGHDATPFLLDYIQKATNGRSVDVNLAIYYGNVALGGQIATALSRQG